MLRTLASFTHRKEKGFTLVELAIVLGVSSLLLTGLWRLMSSGSTRTRDQVAAEQHRKLLLAVQSYLETQQGQEDALRSLNPNGGIGTLPIPLGNWATVQDCKALANMSANATFCEYLPPGFNNTTRNPYNQVYMIRVRKDDNSAVGTMPKNYSFAVMTTGGQTIPDTSGSRIASLIGRDGGFVYAQNVCGANHLCGSYGTWSIAPSSEYNFSMVAGHIGSVSYRGGNVASDTFWLARKDVPGDNIVNGHGDLNTLQTDIGLNGRTLDGSTTATGDDYGSEIVNLRKLVVGTTNPDINNLKNAPLKVMMPTCATPSDLMKCDPGLDVQGNVNILGLLKANLLYAGQFVYQTTTSDSRLKTEITELKDAADHLAKAKGYSFTMKDTGEKRYGVVAQEIEKYYPEIVHKDVDGMRSVDYMGLIGPLVAAVSDLKAENEQLRKDLDALKQQVESPKPKSKAKGK